MTYFILGMLCSPFLESCIEFENKEKLYESKIICRREAMINLRKIVLEFKQQEFPVKIFITCKEYNPWLQ
jgi:hypothetical protein